MASQSRTSSTARKVTDCKGSRARVNCVRFPVNTRLYRRKRTFILNYLAHIYLASYSDNAMLGALMGDFVKPHAGLDFPAETEAEIITHRKIDCFTDSHPIVLEAKRLFATPSRRYAGILLDVFYDHLLAKKWEHFSAEPLDDFIARFYELLSRQALANALPPRLAQAVPYMVEQDWLGSYRDFVGVKVAIDRISTRLSRKPELLRDGVADLEEHYVELSRGFDAFFPELINFVAGHRQGAIVAITRPVVLPKSVR